MIATHCPRSSGDDSITRWHWLLLALALLAGQLVAGCGRAESGPDPQLAARRARLLLASEPADALGVLDARQSCQPGQEAVIVGRVGGTANPWSPGQATFVMADAALAHDGGQHDHCPDGCPFCEAKRTAQAGLAVVQFVDQRGQVLPLDAQELFGIGPRDTVVVRGRVDQNGPDGMLIVSASGLYVRR